MFKHPRFQGLSILALGAGGDVLAASEFESLDRRRAQPRLASRPKPQNPRFRICESLKRSRRRRRKPARLTQETQHRLHHRR